MASPRSRCVSCTIPPWATADEHGAGGAVVEEIGDFDNVVVDAVDDTGTEVGESEDGLAAGGSFESLEQDNENTPSTRVRAVSLIPAEARTALLRFPVGSLGPCAASVPVGTVGGVRWRTLVLVVALGLVGLTQATDTPARVATTVAAEHGGALQP